MGDRLSGRGVCVCSINLRLSGGGGAHGSPTAWLLAPSWESPLGLAELEEEEPKLEGGVTCRGCTRFQVQSLTLSVKGSSSGR